MSAPAASVPPAVATRARRSLAGRRTRSALNRPSNVLTLAMVAALVYFILPLVWLVIAIFFSVALYPVVNWVQHKVTEPRRALATFWVKST